MTTTTWVKSSYSNPSGNCVETNTSPLGWCVRDSTDPTGPMLVVPGASWAVFTSSVQDGVFD